MTPHPAATLLDAYAAAGLDLARSADVEVHLEACAACRAAVAARAAPALAVDLDRMWAGVVDRLDAPVPGAVERLARRLGASEPTARLLAATPALHLSWLCAVAGVLAFAVAAAHAAPRGISVFLALAPLIPLAGVAAAYGPDVDPAYEIGLAAPMRSSRLLLIRAVAVLVTSAALAGAAALALPAVGWVAAAWLLPSLALSLVSLALGAFVSPLRASGALGVAWLVAVAAVTLDRASATALLGPSAQAVWAALAVAAAVLVASQHRRYETVVEG
jgi:hypothetical protein